MALFTKVVGAHDYRAFWLSPISAGDENNRSAATLVISMLLTLDTQSRASSVVSQNSQQTQTQTQTQTQPQTPSMLPSPGGSPMMSPSDSPQSVLKVSSEGVGVGVGPVEREAMTQQQQQGQQQQTEATVEAKVASALHFVSLFWEFDAMEKTFKATFDKWSKAVAANPRQYDERNLLSTELLPALLLGNLSDPIWNWAEICAGAKYRPFGVPLLKTLLSRETWGYAKTGQDIVQQIVSTQSRDVFLLSTTLLRVFLSHCPRDTTEIVEAAIAALQDKIMPGKCGREVDRLLSFLERERLSPGCSFRETVLSENPWLLSDNQPAALPPAYVLVEKGHANSERLASMATFWKRHRVSPSSVRLRFFAYIMSKELGLSQTLLATQFLESGDAGALFEEANAILDSCLGCSTPDEARVLRKEGFARVHAKMLARLRTKPQVALPMLSGCPRIPSLNFALHLEDVSRSVAESQPALSHAVPFCQDLLRILAKHAAVRDNLAKASPTPRNDAGRATKIVVLGSDRLAELTIGTYLRFCAESERNATALRAQFYFASGESSISRELAASDRWFNLHVVEGLRFMQSVFPQFPDGEQLCSIKYEAPAVSAASQNFVLGNTFSGSRTPNPPSMVASVIEGVCRDSRVTLELPISLCRCFGASESCIPFVANITIVPHDAATNGPRTGRSPYSVTTIVHQPGGSQEPRTEQKRVFGMTVRQSWVPPYNLELLTRAEDDPKKTKLPDVVRIADAYIFMDENRPFYVFSGLLQHGPFTKVFISQSSVLFPLMRFLPNGND